MTDSSTERLLSAIWGNRKGYVFVPHKDLTDERKWHETPGIPINGSLPPINIPERSDVYFCPVVFSEPQRRKEYALPTNLLWADLDPVNPNDCRVRPSIAWESSPGRFQALWFLNREVDPDEAASLSKRIAYADGADTGGWDLTQVLRLPGTKNFKYPAAPTVKLLWAKRASYSPDEIKRKYPPVNGEAKHDLDWPAANEIEIQSAIKSLSRGLQARIR
ncbi:MAG TPA: DNA-primase RepB domain-containing protein, partial [Patescibacteria group bacterium]|nr:DNA-primase RepB domain-containing protein [Patescibacteria group bacterium]